MTKSPQEYTVPDLLAFYERVNPVLSAWLAKPVWSAREAALLCAGFVPRGSENEEGAGRDSRESIEGGTPIDPSGYVPPSERLLNGFLKLLDGKGAASPLEMVNALRPTIPRAITKISENGKDFWVETRRVLTLKSLQDIQWLLIIGNVVGLPVPALVPFRLLNGLHDRLSGQFNAARSNEQTQERLAAPLTLIAAGKNGQPVVINQVSKIEQAAEVELSLKRQKSRGRQPLQTTPEQRGYYKTEEVAGLTDLLPDTLNKYAREGIVVEGFTPFKRHNRRPWQWRDNRQQALHTLSAAGQAMPDSQQAKSLSSLLGPEPFKKR